MAVVQRYVCLCSLFLPFLCWGSTQLSVGAMGLSFHGFEEEPIYTQNMPRRLDENARWVPSYELFVRYRPGAHQHWMGSVGQDCYQNFATYAAWGLYWNFVRYIDYGFVIGAYYRRTRPISYNGETRNIKEFYTLDVGEGNQFVPMPLATVSLHIPVFQKTGIGINVGSNFFITHFVATLVFDIDEGHTPMIRGNSAPGL